MNPTNLTDEGLSELADKLYDVTQNNGKSDSIFSILSELRQVRDAAKKEEREACAKVAEKWVYYDDPTSGTDPSRHEIATAIRQMEVR